MCMSGAKSDTKSGGKETDGGIERRQLKVPDRFKVVVESNERLWYGLTNRTWSSGYTTIRRLARWNRLATVGYCVHHTKNSAGIHERTRDPGWIHVARWRLERRENMDIKHGQKQEISFVHAHAGCKQSH